MYRQRTAASLEQGLGDDPTADQVAYDSLLSGWEDYLAHDNDGRPVIFIGHSQGAAMLIRLLRSQIDPHPALRKKMVSAIILGGNVQVPRGKTVGGSFDHIPTCGFAAGDGLRHRLFDLWVRPSDLVRLRPARTGGQPAIGSDHLERGTGRLREPGDRSRTPRVPCSRISRAPATSVPGVKVTTPWVSFPGLYTAQCESKGGATWLQVDSTVDVRRSAPARDRLTRSGLGVPRRRRQPRLGQPRPGRGAGGSRLRRLSGMCSAEGWSSAARSHFHRGRRR